MLERKFLRDNREAVERACAAKGMEVDLDKLYGLDAETLRLKHELEEMKRRRNELSAEVGKLKKEGKDAAKVMAEVKEQDGKEKELSARARETENEYLELASWVPNIPHESTPVGANEKDNKMVRLVGEKPELGFKPRAHWDIGEALGIVDFKRAAKLAGSRFNVLYGNGARLERALISFMLDKATKENGYSEVYPPCLATRETLYNCAQLPKLEDDMYRFREDENDMAKDIFLIPTAEVQLMNLRGGETLEGAELPIRYAAYTPSFRREAGSYGKDTRGVIRQHQFDKVELFQLTKAEDSYQVLEEMLVHSESVLKALGLHYQVVLKCSGDISFASSKSYDLEVWMPGQDSYVEIASISNCTDFQARRAGIRCRDGKKTGFVHTLNASGLAVGRTWAAILENCQQKDGSINVPEILWAYMDGMKVICKEEKEGK